MAVVRMLMSAPMIALFAGLVSTLVSQAAPSDGPRGADQVRVVGIELDADGEGGTLWTEAERLSGTDRGFVFGRGDCTKHPVGDRVLHALFDAMKSGARVQVRSVKQPGGTHCLRGVRFAAP